MSFGPHEIVSIVFLIVFVILLPPSVYLWVTFIRAGYHWRYGFWGATLLCVARIGAFVSELIFYGQGKFVNNTNYNAYIAYQVMLGIGYIGLIGCESALFTTWAERSIGLNDLQTLITSKIGLLNLVAIILVVVGATDLSSQDASKRSNGNTLYEAGICLFLVLTVVQALFVAYGWTRVGRFSRSLMFISITLVFLLVRIIYSTYAAFHRQDSAISLLNNHNIGLLVGPFLMMEVCALIVMLFLGFNTVRRPDFVGPKNKQASVPQQQQTYVMNSPQQGYATPSHAVPTQQQQYGQQGGYRSNV